MIRFSKIIRYTIISLLLLFSFVMNSYAIETTKISISKDIGISEELNFSIRKQCTGHSVFYDADANENGDYIILAAFEHISAQNEKEPNLHTYYIDIYNSNNEFLCELTFVKRFGADIAFNDRDVYIFFVDDVLIYNIDSGEASYHNVTIPGTWKKYDRQDIQSFTVGKWEYNCIEDGAGYRELSRTDGTEKEILVSLDEDPFLKFDFKKSIPNIILGLLSDVLLIIVVVKLTKKRCRYKNNKGKTVYKVDGFYTIDDKGRIH